MSSQQFSEKEKESNINVDDNVSNELGVLDSG
jgi:hypothetical protein